MIGLLDNLLRDLLSKHISELSGENRIGFQPPDEDWISRVKASEHNLLNIYLVDLRENRKLRSNEQVRLVDKGRASFQCSPVRLDCHYLISAWSPAQASQDIEPTIDEHDLLYQVASVLTEHSPLNPSTIYNSGLAGNLTNWEALQDWDFIKQNGLPAIVLSPDGYNKLSEFWHSMGHNARFKPVLYLSVTIPISLHPIVAGPIVTSRMIEYRYPNQLDSAEVWMQIGGYVLDATQLQQNEPPKPLPHAWVELTTRDNISLQTTETDELGRFMFSNLQQGRYRLEARAAGLDPKSQDIEVPSTTANYDLVFRSS